MNSNKTKIFSFFLFAFVFASLVFAQPKAVIHPMEYDFGDIVQDSIVTKIFGCTAVVAGKNELMPNESTDIKVTFNSEGKSGKQNKTVYIETNDPKNSTIKLSITGNVLKKERSSTQIEKSKT